MLITCAHFSWAQADCRILFVYKATIVSHSVKIEKIGVPSTRLLVGYISADNDLAFQYSKPVGGEFSDTLISHLSSEFCGEIDNVIKNVFIGNKKQYTIRISSYRSERFTEALIPIESIKFVPIKKANGVHLIIDLGTIEL